MNAYVYVLGLMLAGAVLGAGLARRSGGRLPDMAQYAGVAAIIGGVIGILLTIALFRLS